jgi:MFS family permease
MIDVLRRNPDFRRLFIAAVISMLGDWFSFVALSGLLIEITGKQSTAAYAYAAMVLPIFFASPIAGAIADRWNRKTIMIVADLARVPFALLLIAAAYWRNVPLSIVCMACISIGAAFADPVSSAALPNLVAKEDLSAAQTLMSASWGSMLIVGAGLGGLVSAYFGRTAAFVIDAASFAVSAGVLMTIRAPTQTFAVGAAAAAAAANSRNIGQPKTPPLWPHLRRSPITLRLMIAKGGVSCANGTVGLLPGLVLTTFSGTERLLGFVLAARGLGALLGPPLARLVVGKSPSIRSIVWICSISTALYAMCYAVVPVLPSLVLVMVVVAIAHLGGGAQWAMSSYGLLTQTPDNLRGRVMSIDYGIATLAIGASALAAGLLADFSSLHTAMWILCSVGGSYAVAWLAITWRWARAPTEHQPR